MNTYTQTIWANYQEKVEGVSITCLSKKMNEKITKMIEEGKIQITFQIKR